MIDIIIFSKDRAMQLDALIRSMQKYFVGDWRATVLYKASSEPHKKSYNTLVNKYSETIWIEERVFWDDIKAFWGASSDAFMFGTDDCLIYRSIDLNKVCNLLNNEENWCVSLRLGENTTTQCYWTNQQCPPLNIESRDDEFIKWKWTYYNWAASNWAYLPSLDFVAYRKRSFLNILPDNFNPRIPRHLEGALVNWEVATKVARTSPYFVAPERSCAVCLSVNAVQEEPVTFGVKYYYGIEELNEKFLAGQIIDFDSMDFSNIVGAHQEIEFKFK